MEAPSWARWKGVHTGTDYIGWFSDDKFEYFKKGGADRTTGDNYYPPKDWEACGWKFEEVNICLENK